MALAKLAIVKRLILIVVFVVSGCRRRHPSVDELRTADKDWQRPQQIAHADLEPAFLVVFDGDSVTAGHGIPSNRSYPVLVVAKLRSDGYNFDAFNIARCYDTLQDLDARGHQTDALARNHAYSRRVLIGWAGTNNLAFGVSDASRTAASIEKYIRDRENAGFEVHFIAPLHRITPPGFEQLRWELMALPIARRMISPGDPALIDGIHLSADGAAEIAKIVSALIEH